MSNTYNKSIQMPKKHQKAQSASLLFKGMRFNVMLLTLTFIYLTSSSYATAAQHRDIRCVICSAYTGPAKPPDQKRTAEFMSFLLHWAYPASEPFVYPIPER